MPPRRPRDRSPPHSRLPTKGHKNVNTFFSKISQVRSRSKDRRRSKQQDIDPWSKDDTCISCRSMMNSSSASTLTTKSRSASNCPGHRGKSAPTLTTKGSLGSVNASKTFYSRPPPPPPPQRSTPQQFLSVLHKSASTSALGISVDNSGGAMHPSQPARPTVVQSKSREDFSSVGSSPYPRGVAAPSPTGSVPPPPPANSTRIRRSHHDLSSSCNSNSLRFHKTQLPPPPPPRRTMSKGALQQDGHHHLNNTYGSIPPSNDIVPATAISTSSTTKTQPPKHRSSHNNRKTHPVSSMGYTDPYGDYGLYSGDVDDTSRPHGKGKMKYDNGIFYKGNWIHGYKDESQGNSSGDHYSTNVTRERMLSGFTSWKGQKKKDGEDDNDRGTFVYGMVWADYAGLSGKYTGHVNADSIPNGKGVMRYEFGLVVEGDWIRGKLNDGGGGGMSNGVMAQSVAGGMSVDPGGMSVSGGAASVVSGLYLMSIVGSGGGDGMMMGGYPHYIMGHNGLNTFTSSSYLEVAAYYNPAGTMMGGSPVAISYHHQQQHGTTNHPAAPEPAVGDT